MSATAKLSSKYQATIPASVRRGLGLRPGDRMVFDVRREGSTVMATLRRFPSLDELSGSVPVPPDIRGLAWSDIRARAWAPHPSDDS